jgi:ribosome-binding protein aMBF1 (putative translation factor)
MTTKVARRTSRQVSTSAPRVRRPKKEATQLERTLRDAVKAHGNNYELAQLVGISPTILSRFARQERNLRLDTASKLADVLGLVLTEAK